MLSVFSFLIFFISETKGNNALRHDFLSVWLGVKWLIFKTFSCLFHYESIFLRVNDVCIIFMKYYENKPHNIGNLFWVFDKSIFWNLKKIRTPSTLTRALEPTSECTWLEPFQHWKKGFWQSFSIIVKTHFITFYGHESEFVIWIFKKMYQYLETQFMVYFYFYYYVMIYYLMN